MNREHYEHSHQSQKEEVIHSNTNTAILYSFFSGYRQYNQKKAVSYKN